MSKYKFEKYLTKISKLNNQIGGHDLISLCQSFIEYRKKHYKGLYEQNGDLISNEHKTIQYTPLYGEIHHKSFIDLSNFGIFVQSNHIKLDLFIGVTNIFDRSGKSNSSPNSDYQRFNGKRNTMVVQNYYSVNIFKCDPIGFFLDMNDDNVIKVFNEYFPNTFNKIIIDYSTMKMLTKIKNLAFDKILNIGGKAYIDLAFNSIPQRQIENNDFFEAYVSEKNNLASDYIKLLKTKAKKIINQLPLSQRPNPQSSEMDDLMFEICKYINKPQFELWYLYY